MTALLVGLLALTAPAAPTEKEAAELRRFLNVHLRDIQACYEDELTRNPALRGSLGAKVTVTTGGMVSNVEFLKDELHDPPVNACIERRVRAFVFPFKPSKPTQVEFAWNFVPDSATAQATPAPQATPSENTRIAIVDISPAFSTGPYTTLRVDDKDPRILAVGTQDGVVSWSNDSGKSGHDTAAARPRSLQYMGFRPDDRTWATFFSTPWASFFPTNGPMSMGPLVSPSWNETAASTAQALLQPRDIAVTGLTGGSDFGSGSNAGEFSEDDMPAGDRLFMSLLNANKPTLRWQRWMSVDDLQTPINDLAFVGAGGKLLAATAVGIHVSDRSRGSWTQVIGGPQTRRLSLQGFDPDGAGVQGTAVAIDPTDPSHVLAGTSNGLMVSTNGGETFFPHLDPKLADDPIYHFIWSQESPDRIIAITSRSVLISKDRGKTFSAVLSTPADINALSIGPNATYAATREGLIEMGFDGKNKTFLKDEVVVGVIALTQELVLVATESTLEVLPLSAGQEPLVLKRAHTADPFVGLAGNAELSYALTKNGIFRISSAGPPPPPRGRQPQLRLTLAETEARVGKFQPLVTPLQARLMRDWPRVYYLIPTQISVLAFDTTGNIPTITHSGLLSELPFSQASGTALNDVGIFVWATFNNLPNILYGRISNPLNMKQTNLRTVKDDTLAQVRAHYRACEELIVALRHPPDDPEQELLLKLRIEEDAAYLEAMAGEPVVLIDEEDF